MKNIGQELRKELHQFARFAVIGFREVKSGEELDYFDKYVDGLAGARVKQLFVEFAEGLREEARGFEMKFCSHHRKLLDDKIDQAISAVTKTTKAIEGKE